MFGARRRTRARDPVGEIGTVDDDKERRVGLRPRRLRFRGCGAKSATGAADSRSNRGSKGRRSRTGPHPGRSHGPAPTPADRAAATAEQRPRQRRTQSVARFFRGDQIDRRIAHMPVWVDCAEPPATPMTKIPARSAAAMSSAGSAIMVLLAATAIPAVSPVPCWRRSGDRSSANRTACPASAWALSPAPPRLSDCHSPSGAQIGDASEHVVGAFGRLDRQNVFIGDNCSLAHIE